MTNTKSYVIPKGKTTSDSDICEFPINSHLLHVHKHKVTVNVPIKKSAS